MTTTHEATDSDPCLNNPVLKVDRESRGSLRPLTYTVRQRR